MLRANEEQLQQATNIGIINLRQAEIDYYCQVNTAIGTQAALLSGFLYMTFTQNTVDYEQSYSHWIRSAYFVMSALTVATGLYVIIATMLLQVLGPGLALNGPVGSMARASEALQSEQRHVIWAFTMMMISFAVTTALTFWFVSSRTSSLSSLVVFVIAARFWITYGRRVFARFYWEAMTGSDWAGKPSSHTSAQHNDPSEPRFKTENESEEDGMVAMEGYVTKRGVSATGIAGKLSKEPWERRYFVLNNRGQMYYYKNRQEYRADPVSGRIKARPIELEEYYVETTNTAAASAAPSETASVVTGVTVNGGSVPEFQMTLRPREEEGLFRHWHLRCDTEKLLGEWLSAAARVSPSSFPVVNGRQQR